MDMVGIGYKLGFSLTIKITVNADQITQITLTEIYQREKTKAKTGKERKTTRFENIRFN